MLPFVPRKVARKLPSTTTSSNLQKDPKSDGASSSTASAAAGPSSAPQQHVTADIKGKGRASAAELTSEECSGLFTLSLSDYALWSSPDLRRVMETSNDGCTSLHRPRLDPHTTLTIWSADVPVSYILSECPGFSSLGSPPTEASLVKAIRAQAADTVDVRVLMSSPSRAAWYGRHAPPRNLGGYEFRLKNMEEILQRVVGNSRQDWDAKTVYIVSNHSHCKTRLLIEA